MSDRHFWKYAPGAALSADGVYEVSTVDRNSYLYRKNGSIVFVPCEHFEKNDQPSVAFDLKNELHYLTHEGRLPVPDEDIGEIKSVLAEAVAVIGRNVFFD